MSAKHEVRIEGPTRDLFRLAADRIEAEAKAGRPLRHADVWLMATDDGDANPNGDLHGLAFLDFGPDSGGAALPAAAIREPRMGFAEGSLT